jgi:Ca2+-dependent lipid-binding protein
MLTHYPYIGSVGVSLIEPPFVDFELPLGGVDVMALPMLRGVVRMATKLVSRQFVVFPRCEKSSSLQLSLRFLFQGSL